MEENQNKSVKTEKSKSLKERLKTILIIVLTIVIILLLLVRCSGIRNKGTDETVNVGEQTNEKIDEMTAEEKQAYVNQIVEDSMININFSPYATFDSNGNSTSFLVKNIEQNHDSIKFTLYDEDNNLIFESSEIERGYQCESIKLNTPLTVGTHEGRIVVGYANTGTVSSSFPITMEVTE